MVVPCYNEEGNIANMHDRLVTVFSGIGAPYEIIFVNNGSFDNSAVVFDKVVKADVNVKVVSLSRNYGSQSAYSCGLNYTNGDCVLCLDGDIQDPPELLPQMLEKWSAGYDVVYGVRVRRKGGLARRIGYKLFYRLFRKLSYIDMPLDAGDFALLDRRVVMALHLLPERDRFLRGLRAWVGFKQAGIGYTRNEREWGRTSNSFTDNFRWASRGIFSFSYKPLEMISIVAGVMVAIALLGIVVYVVLYFVSPHTPPGFATLIVAVLFLGAIQLASLAIIGEYLGRMFEEIKRRPLYLVDEIMDQNGVIKPDMRSDRDR